MNSPLEHSRTSSPAAPSDTALRTTRASSVPADQLKTAHAAREISRIAVLTAGLQQMRASEAGRRHLAGSSPAGRGTVLSFQQKTTHGMKNGCPRGAIFASRMSRRLLAQAPGRISVRVSRRWRKLTPLRSPDAAPGAQDQAPIQKEAPAFRPEPLSHTLRDQPSVAQRRDSA